MSPTNVNNLKSSFFVTSIFFLIFWALLGGNPQAAIVERESQPDGPPHTGILDTIYQCDETLIGGDRDPIDVLIVTSGWGPLTGISPIAEKDYFLGILSGENYNVVWLDVSAGSLTYSHLNPYDLVIYDAGGYWYPFSGNTSAISQYHQSGRPLFLVAPDINYDWEINGLGSFPADVLHISGALGILPETSFEVIANTGHPIIQSIPTNQHIPVVNESSWPDCFAPGSGTSGVLTQGFISNTEFGVGSCSGLPQYSSYDPQGTLYGVTAYAGSETNGKVALYGFPVTAIQQGAILEELTSSTIQWLLGGVELELTMVAEDAADDQVVRKAPGDIVDFVGHIESMEDDALTGIEARITIPSDRFGDPTKVYLREDATEDNIIADLTADVSESGDNPGTFMVDLPEFPANSSRQIVWRFSIPGTTPAMAIGTSGSVYYNGLVVAGDNAGVAIVNNTEGIIIAHRKLLFDKYKNYHSVEDVTSLLARLFEISDGNNTNEITNVVYYLDRVNGIVENWDQYGVDLSSEGAANACANQVKNLVEARCDRFSQDPEYITIVGGDEIIPFFRINDANYGNDEGFHPYTSPGQQNDPLLSAFNSHYFLSDAPYYDIDGNDWNSGDFELAGGRIMAATASEMETVIDRGLARPSTVTDYMVLASNGGYDVGDIKNRATDRNFNVLNDDETPSTISNNTWFEGDLTGLLQNGFRLSFTGGHGNYNYYWGHDKEPGEGESEDPYALQNTELPNISNGGVLFPGGCRTGVPADAGDTWSPSSSDNNAWTAVSKGACGFIGTLGIATANSLSWIKMYNESFVNDYFKNLIQKNGSLTRSIGKALTRTSNRYNPIFFDGKAQKTTIEYIINGLPWMQVDIPADPGFYFAGANLNVVINPGMVTPQGTYAVDLQFVVPTYTIEDHDGYQLVMGPGAEYFAVEGKPILPIFEAEIPLPYDADIISVETLSAHSLALGNLNIPSPVGCGFPPCPDPMSSDFDVTGLFPTQRIWYTHELEEGSSLLSIDLFAATHDVDTRETILYDTTTVRILFTSDIPILIGSFDLKSYWTGGMPNIEGDVTIKNVGDISVSSITAKMEIYDQFGTPVGQVQQSDLFVSPGDSLIVPLIYFGALPDDRYYCHVMILDAGDNIIAEVADYVWLSAGEMLDFICPDLIIRGEDALYSAIFRNNGTTSLNANELVNIYTTAGTEFASLPGPSVDVPPGVTDTLEVQWNTLGKPLGLYRALGSVFANGIQYGPISDNFLISNGHELRLTNGDVAHDPEVIISNDSVTFTAVVHNYGPYAVDSVIVRSSYGAPGDIPLPLMPDTAIAIPAFSSVTLQCEWITDGLFGPYFITFEVDPDNFYEEAVETDNQANFLLSVGAEEIDWPLFVPDTLYYLFCFSVTPMTGIIYYSGFEGYLPSDINNATVRVNGAMVPDSVKTVLMNEEEVIAVYIPLKEFILSYGLLFDVLSYEYTITGQFEDESEFSIVDSVVIVGHRLGDVNVDGKINILDMLFIVSYLYQNGPEPELPILADVNCDGIINVRDLTFLIDYIYGNGPEPDCL